MSLYTKHYHRFIRGIAVRRKSFLFRSGTRDFIYPQRGNIWDTSFLEEAMCDAFILFTVSELETYLEGILQDSISVYENMFDASVLKKCGAIKGFGEKFSQQKTNLSKNNNANWNRISNYFLFVGFSKDRDFPQDFWDDVEIVVQHRGGVAHNGVSLSIIEDRRNVIHKIEEVTRKLRIFDSQFNSWIESMSCEIERLESSSLIFRPEF